MDLRCEWQGKVPDGLYFILHRADSLAVHMKTQEVERSCTQDTLAGVNVEAMVLKTGKKLMEMILVFLGGGAGDQNVVQIGIHKG